jgi:Arc/MetJ-type ribon-helix-helix transcriptional regulator
MATYPMKKKATFVLDVSVLEAAQSLVQAGAVKSMNALVEQALTDFLDKLRRQELQQALLAASNDPLFLADVEDVLRDFEAVDQEHWEHET